MLHSPEVWSLMDNSRADGQFPSDTAAAFVTGMLIQLLPARLKPSQNTHEGRQEGSYQMGPI